MGEITKKELSTELIEVIDNKIELSDIPTSLPANGGNSDTVGGLLPSVFSMTGHTHTMNNISDTRIKNGGTATVASTISQSWANDTIKNNSIIFGGDYSGYDTTDANIVFSSSKGKINVVVDGEFYATEGKNRVYHTGNKPTPSDIRAMPSEISGFNIGKTIEINIGGASNTYYPVVITGVNDARAQQLQIQRSYNSPAPSDWDTATHKGGLDIRMETYIAGYGGMEYFTRWFIGQTYSKILADFCMAEPDTSTFIFWLRGGGAYYRIWSDNRNMNATVHLNGYSHYNGTKSYPAITNCIAPLNSVSLYKVFESRPTYRMSSCRRGWSEYRQYDQNYRPYTTSTASPSGGVNGDIWFKYS